MRLRTRPFLLLALLAALAAALLAPAALGAANGLYKGNVTGDESAEVKVKVKDGRVTKFTANVYASCGYENFIISVAYPPVGKEGATAKIKGNKFKVVFKGSPDVEEDKRTVSGTFAGSKVTGSILVEGLCSADVTYSAKR
jgi:spermidine/putrescine-binding protein